MEGELTNQGVEERREEQSQAAKAPVDLEGGRENTVVCEGLVKPQFSPSDSVLTDSGVSEMTNTESDYSDSLEQDDEDAKTPSDCVEAEETLSPPSKAKSEVDELQDSGDASWFDQDASDFFIDANLTHDSGIVEFDPNGDDFTNWDNVKSFFEGLIERQNSELDRIGGFEYEPEAHDSYAVCRSLSADETEMEERAAFRLFQGDEDCLLDTEHLTGPFPSGPRLAMRGASSLSPPKVIHYNFEMHDESWGYSSHEPYFDVVTGRRILSTIYEFEVSSDEDTESVKVEDASWHEAAPARSQKQDAESGGNEGREEEGEKEEDADENTRAKETKQNEEVVIRGGTASDERSSSAVDTWSGDGGTLEDITLPDDHSNTLASPSLMEGREEASAGVVVRHCVNYVMESSEINTGASVIAKDGREDSFSAQSEALRHSSGEIENQDQEYENLVNVDNTAKISPQEPSVGTQDPFITGHTLGGLEAGCLTGDAGAGSGGEGRDTDTSGGDREGGTGGGDGGGEGDDIPTAKTHETSPQMASQESVSFVRGLVFRDDPHPEPGPDAPPAVCLEGTGGETQGHAVSHVEEKVNNGDCIGQKASLREVSGDTKGDLICQSNSPLAISSLRSGEGGTSHSVGSPAKHSFNMQEQDEAQAVNNKRSAEATLTRDPFTCLSPDAAKHLKEDEERPAASDIYTEGHFEEPDTYDLLSSVSTSELQTLKTHESIERVHSSEQGLTEGAEESKGGDVTPIGDTRGPDPPSRPNRKTHHLNTLESRRPAGSSPVQLSSEAVGLDVGDADAPDCVGVPGCVTSRRDGGRGVSGSCQGHHDTHTPESDGKEVLEEEEEAVEARLISDEEMEEGDNEGKGKDVKENKEGDEKENEEERENIPTTLIFTTSSILQQQQQQESIPSATTTTTTTTTRVEAAASPPSWLPTEDALDEDVHAHPQHSPSPTEPPDTTLASPAGDSSSVSPTSATTTASPLKPKRSSRTELKKPIIAKKPVDALKSISGKSRSFEVPARPARRKQTRKAEDSARIEEKEMQIKDNIRSETGVGELEERQISDNRLVNEEEEEEEAGKQGGRHEKEMQIKNSMRSETGVVEVKEWQIGDNRLVNDDEEEEEEEEAGKQCGRHEKVVAADESESMTSRLEASTSEARKGEQGRSDSRLQAEEENMYHDDRLDGGGAEAEGERSSDSGSGGEGGEGKEALEGDTLGTQNAPALRALPATHTNAPHDATTGGPTRQCGNNEDGDEGIIAAVRPDEVLQSQEKNDVVFLEGLCEAGGEEAMVTVRDGEDDVSPSPRASPSQLRDTQVTLETREASDGGAEKELSLVTTKRRDSYPKDQLWALDEESGATGSTERQVPPPRRRRKVSISRSLHQEDMTADPDTLQTQPAPIAPMRKKRQFSSLPRPAKTKPAVRDVSSSLSTSALALASSTQHHACTTHVRSVSAVNIRSCDIPGSSSFPEHNGAAAGRETPRASVESESEGEARSDGSRRLSEGSGQEEKKKRSLKSTLRRTGSLRDKFYTRIQKKIDKSSRRQSDGGPKTKYFSRIFHRKQKLYDMSGPSQLPSEIPEPAPPPQHLTSEETDTFATLLSSYFAPDTKNLGQSDGETRSKYSTLERSAVKALSVQGEDRTIVKRTQQSEEHLTTSKDDSKTTALLQESLVSSNESVKSSEGNSNEGFVYEEIDSTVQGSRLDADSGDEGYQRASDSEDSCSSPGVTAASLPSPEESLDDGCPQPAREDSEEQQPLKDVIKDTAEATADIEDTAEATADIEDTAEATANIEDNAEATADIEDTAEATANIEDNAEATANIEDTAEATANIEDNAEATADIEDTAEATTDTEDEETTTRDDTQTVKAPEENCTPKHQQSDLILIIDEDNYSDATVTAPPSLPPPPPPPPPPAVEESHEEEAGHTWERPTVRLRTWAERQGTQSLSLPALNLRASRAVDLEALDFYYDSDDSQDRDTPSPGPPVEAEKEGRQGSLIKQKSEEDRTQKDRCVEVYPETVRQRQRTMMASNNKVDIKNWNGDHITNNNDTLTSPAKSKKFLPSVKALRNQFEAGKTTNGKTEANGNITTNGTNGSNGQTLSRKSSSSSVSSTTQEAATTNNTIAVTHHTPIAVTHHTPIAPVESLASPAVPEEVQASNEPVEPIFNQFRKVDQELKDLMSKAHTTSGWDPRPLLKRLYYIPEAPKQQSQGTTYVNIEGYLEKLPSGRKKATFWNAWKRRYFMAKNGVLYYYPSAQKDKPSMKMTLMGGKVESMEPNMVGVDDGKGHYVVVRCSSKQEAERWHRALETHTVEDFTSQYVQPWPMPTNPTLLRDILIVDIGSSSIRAGVLASQATLPQVFLPSVVANGREGRSQAWGMDALAPDVRASSTLSFPVRPTHKISKYSVDLSAISSLLQKAFADLKVDPKNYHLQLSVPRVLNANTQAELLRVLFDKFSVRSVNLTHQSILALYAYNATSGIVVDVGERMDIVPVIDGYIVDGGVSRVPYGGHRILDHLRQFLYMRNISLINEVESYIIRQVLESICYCAHHYNTEKARCSQNPDHFQKSVSLADYFGNKEWPYDSISLDFGRFQATEGLFNPDAWGLDHPGLHKLVHKAIMECSMDIRKEMSRSIFLAGGVTQVPGLVERLTTELDNLTPPAIRPKVHASPYRYHAAYIGACVLAESPAFAQSRITLEDWNKHGNATLRKWSL